MKMNQWHLIPRKIKEVIELIRERSDGAELMADFEPLDEKLYK